MRIVALLVCTCCTIAAAEDQVHNVIVARETEITNDQWGKPVESTWANAIRLKKTEDLNPHMFQVYSKSTIDEKLNAVKATTDDLGNKYNNIDANITKAFDKAAQTILTSEVFKTTEKEIIKQITGTLKTAFDKIIANEQAGMTELLGKLNKEYEVLKTERETLSREIARAKTLADELQKQRAEVDAIIRAIKPRQPPTGRVEGE